jgi:hypothetical protein
MSIVSNLVVLLGACMVGDRGVFFGFVLATTGRVRRGEQRADRTRAYRSREKKRTTAVDDIILSIIIDGAGGTDIVLNFLLNGVHDRECTEVL